MTIRDVMINVAYKYKRGYHVFTSPDIKGLYVASKDAKRAFDGVAPSLKTILSYKLRDRYEPSQIDVFAVTTYDEFINNLCFDGSEIEPTMEDRAFSVKLAA